MNSAVCPSQVGWKRLGDQGWKRLSECGDACFWRGVTFVFKTRDLGPNGLPYQYAMAVTVGVSDRLAFMSDEGLLWAHGPDELPIESNYNGHPGTLSADWLRRNLSCLGKIDDPESVWYARRSWFVPEFENRGR
jgi:hypothetical protein